MKHEERRKSLDLPTNKLCIQGFARNLKMKLLEENKITQQQEYSRVRDVFLDKLSKKCSENSDNQLYPEDFSFIGEAGFSKWWHGENFPDSNNRARANLLFNGLSDKWFKRVNFRNRLQMYLSSLDLFHLANNLENRDQSFIESNAIIDSIYKDWKPCYPGLMGQPFICISGPESRAGSPFRGEEKQVGYNYIEVRDPRFDIPYNLEIGPCSYVKEEIPEYIADKFDNGNYASVPDYLLGLICNHSKKESHIYLADLMFDYLTSLNACIAIWLKQNDYHLFTLQHPKNECIYLLRKLILFLYEEHDTDNKYLEYSDEIFDDLTFGINKPAIIDIAKLFINSIFDDAKDEYGFYKMEESKIREYLYDETIEALSRAKLTYFKSFEQNGLSKQIVVENMNKIYLDFFKTFSKINEDDYGRNKSSPYTT